jgi:molybdopterin converting factor small subunit
LPLAWLFGLEVAMNNIKTLMSLGHDVKLTAEQAKEVLSIAHEVDLLKDLCEKLNKEKKELALAVAKKAFMIGLNRETPEMPSPHMRTASSIDMWHLNMESHAEAVAYAIFRVEIERQNEAPK